MAEDRTFLLIGDFKDNITPGLDNINNSINNLKKNFSTLGSRRGAGFDQITKSVGSLVSAQKHLATSIKEVGQAAATATENLKDYKQALGKVASAHYHISRSGTAASKAQAEFWKSARRELANYERQLNKIQSITRAPRLPSGRSRAAGDIGGGAMLPPDLGGGGRRSGGGRGNSYAAGVGGVILGNTLGYTITNSIARGFQIGVGMMYRPFQYAANAMGERIQDEMSDVRAAGGLFAINQLLVGKGKTGFLSGFGEAEEITRQNNRYLAKLAGTLPGDTQDYIQVSKQISDGIYKILSQDKENFINFASEVAAGNQRAAITGTGKKAMQQAGTEVLGEMTKLTVLAGMGGKQGAYGLPQLVERMMSQDQVSMGQFQRYAAIFRDPMIFGALERNIGEINKSGAGTTERIRALHSMLKEIVTPELVSRYRRTAAGFIESFRTMFLNPEVGLFGLGREIEGLGKKMNEFGQYLDANGKVTEDLNKAASANLSIFQALRDTFANLTVVIDPILEILPTIFPIFRQLGKVLEVFRHNTAQITKRFFTYNRFFEEMADAMPDSTQLQKEQKAAMKGQAGIRATMGVMADLLKQFGVMDAAEYKEVANFLNQEKVIDMDELTAQLSSMTSRLLKSPMMEQIGASIGAVVGTVLNELANAIKTFVQTGAQVGIFKGFADAFKTAGGFEAIETIFFNLIDFVVKSIMSLFQNMPELMAGLTLGGLGLMALPAIIGALITELVSNLFYAGKGSIVDQLAQVMGKGSKKGTEIPPKLRPTVSSLDVKLGKAQKFEVVDDIQDVAKELNFFEEFFSELKRQLKGVGGILKSLMGSLLSLNLKGAFLKLDDAGKNLGANIDNFLDDLGPSLKKFGGKLKGLNLGEGVVEAVSSLIIPLDNLRLRLLGFKGKFSFPKLADIGDIILDTLLRPLDKLLTVLEALPSKISELFGKVSVGKLLSKLDGLGAAFTRPLDNLLDALYASGKKFSPTKALAAPGKAIKGIPGFLEGLFGKGKGALMGGLKGIGKGNTLLKTGFGKAMEGVTKGFQTMRKTLGKFGIVFEGVFGLFNMILNLFQGKDILSSFTDAFAPVIVTLIGAAFGPLGLIIAALVSDLQIFKDLLYGFMQGLSWGMEQLTIAFEPILDILSLLFGEMNETESSLKVMNFAFIATKLALAPFISAIRLTALLVLGFGRAIVGLELLLSRIGVGFRKTADIQEHLNKMNAMDEKWRAQELQMWKDTVKGLDATQVQARLSANALGDLGKAASDATAEIKKKPEETAPKTDPRYSPAELERRAAAVAGRLLLDDRMNVARLAEHHIEVNPSVLLDSKGNKMSKAEYIKQLSTNRMFDIMGGTAPLLSDLGQKLPEEVKKSTKEAEKATKATEETKQATTDLKAETTRKLAPLPQIASWADAIYSLLASGSLRVQSSLSPSLFQNTPQANALFNSPVPQGAPQGYVEFLRNLSIENPKPRIGFQGHLGDALATEMKNKPPGSDLLIANSSETVIPAAGGYGMSDFVQTLSSGFRFVDSQLSKLNEEIKKSKESQENTLKAIDQTLKTNQQQTNLRLQKLETKFSTPSIGGLGGGSVGGGVDSFTPIAQGFGLQMTSSYRPGDPGWHGANRARDYSNSTGPTPQMLAFAKYLAQNYGRSLKELIYTPLGFSIKNGQMIPPIAQGSHYNHVHVAYALGAGRPAFFTNQKDAVAWENKFLGKGVESITTNSAELAKAGDGMMGPAWLPWNWGKFVDQERKTSPLNRTNRRLEEMIEKGYISPNTLQRSSTGGSEGGPVNVSTSITIQQQPGQNAEELASLVAMKISEAVEDARAASIFA